MDISGNRDGSAGFLRTRAGGAITDSNMHSLLHNLKRLGTFAGIGLFLFNVMAPAAAKDEAPPILTKKLQMSLLN